MALTTRAQTPVVGTQPLGRSSRYRGTDSTDAYADTGTCHGHGGEVAAHRAGIANKIRRQAARQRNDGDSPTPAAPPVRAPTSATPCRRRSCRARSPNSPAPTGPAIRVGPVLVMCPFVLTLDQAVLRGDQTRQKRTHAGPASTPKRSGIIEHRPETPAPRQARDTERIMRRCANRLLARPRVDLGLCLGHPRNINFD